MLTDVSGWVITTGKLYTVLWLTAMTAPWVCFRQYIVERDQTRAIGFAMVMIGAWLFAGLALGTATYPVIGGAPVVSFLIWLALLTVVVAPVAIHLLAFIATVVLAATVAERGTVSETVQAITYAMAPAVFLAVPLDAVQAAFALFGSLLLVYGLKVVHSTSIWRAFLAGIIPAYLLFGVGFGADAAIVEMLRTYYII